MAHPLQPDLLDWTAPEAVERFDPVVVRAATVAGRISKAVSAALQGKDRGKIAKQMADYLGTPFSKAMLDSYASEAREDHAISAVRLMALLHATRDRRLLQVFADEIDAAVVDRRHVFRIKQAEIHEKVAELNEQAKYLGRRARA